MQLIRLLFSISPARIAAVFAAGVASGVFSTGWLMLIQRAVQHGPQRHPTVLGFEVPGHPIALYAAVGLIAVIAAAFSQVLLIRLTQDAIYQLRAQLSSGMVAAPLERLERLGSHRLLAIMTEDVQSLSQAVGAIPNFCVDVVTIVACLVWLSCVSGPIFTATVAGTALGIFGVEVLLRRVRRLFRQARESEDSLLRSFQAMTAGVKELKLHRGRRRDFMHRHLLGSARILREQNSAAGSRASIAHGYGRLMQMVTIAGVLFVVAAELELKPEVMVKWLVITMFLSTPMQSLMQRIPDLLRGDVALAKIRAMNLSMQSSGNEDQLPYDDRPAATKAWLELTNVSYTYHGEQASASAAGPGGPPQGPPPQGPGRRRRGRGGNADRPMPPPGGPAGEDGGEPGFHLGPMDLVFEPGQITFIVGGNGSGKSTLAKLLMGLYTPEHGSVALNGEKIGHENIEWFRQNCSAVFADFHLFEDYLGFDRPGIDDEVRYYLEELELSHKVTVQDGRLSTIALSQGQRKRLALLTAMLDDRPIYLFDEWAADQDPRFREVFYTEILPGLKRRGKTVIVITHDDRYFHCADQIVKLDFGQIADTNPPTSVRPTTPQVHKARRDPRSLVGKCLLCNGSGSTEAVAVG